MFNLKVKKYNTFSGTVQSRNKNRTTKMMAILMGTYYGFFLPNTINHYIEYDAFLKTYISRVCFLIFFLNAIVNPMIYGWMNNEFKTAFKTILGLKVTKTPVRGESMSRMSIRTISGQGPVT